MEIELKLSNVLSNLDEFLLRKKLYFNGNFNTEIPENVKNKNIYINEYYLKEIIYKFLTDKDFRKIFNYSKNEINDLLNLMKIEYNELTEFLSTSNFVFKLTKGLLLKNKLLENEARKNFILKMKEKSKIK